MGHEDNGDVLGTSSAISVMSPLSCLSHLHPSGGYSVPWSVGLLHYRVASWAPQTTSALRCAPPVTADNLVCVSLSLLLHTG